MTATQLEVSCPKCGGKMWDNRLTKKNPKQPDFKCRQQTCDGVIWPPRGAQAVAAPTPVAAPAERPVWLDEQEEAEATGAPNVGRWFAHYDKCFLHAVGLATRVEKTGVVVTLEGVSAIAATLFIATKSAI